MSSMEKGVFAFLDCLGFKGIWRDNNPAQVLEKLTRIEKSVELDFSPLALGFPSVDRARIIPKIALISDSIAISVRLVDDQGSAINAPVELVGRSCAYIIALNRYFIEESPHFALRGCITYGEHLSSGKFVIGPAVDDAVELEQLPNGAFIWLAPKVAGYFETYRSDWIAQIEQEVRVLSGLEGNHDNRRRLAALRGHAETGLPPLVLSDYEMPIKAGERIRCSIINPLMIGAGIVDSEKILESYEKTMVSDKVDVILKRQHTLKFLNQCYESRDDYDARLVKNLADYRELVTNQVKNRQSCLNHNQNESYE